MSQPPESLSALVTRPLSALTQHAKKIDHIAIAVPDLEKSIKWYTEVMGFSVRERRRTEGSKTAMLSAVLDAGSITFVLLQGLSEESQVTRYVEHYGPGVQHIAIEVDNLETVAAELEEAGMEFDTQIIDGPGLRQIFTRRDQGSGMMYEIIERHGGDFSDTSVEQLFKQLEEKDAF